jgi:hypothetical protein
MMEINDKVGCLISIRKPKRKSCHNLPIDQSSFPSAALQCNDVRAGEQRTALIKPDVIEWQKVPAE